MTPEEMAYYKEYQDGRGKGKFENNESYGVIMNKDQLYDLYEQLLLDHGILYTDQLIQELINIYFQKNEQYPKEYT